MNCEQKPICPNPAKYKVYWPGQTIIVCEEHKRRTLNLASAMGFFVDFEEIQLENLDGNRPENLSKI